MNDINDNEPVRDAADAVVLATLAAIGSDLPARFAFFRRPLAVALEAARIHLS
jgi:hypothetical protein